MNAPIFHPAIGDLIPPDKNQPLFTLLQMLCHLFRSFIVYCYYRKITIHAQEDVFFTTKQWAFFAQGICKKGMSCSMEKLKRNGVAWILFQAY
jgi:hypothetical protein